MALRESVRIIFDILHDLGNAPRGISRGELVKRHSISASSAHKYIRLIEDMGVPIYTEGQRYLVDENYYVNLKLTSEEGEFLFLALERALTTQTAQSQTVRSLIYKLARKLHPHLAGELQERFRGEQSNMEAARIFTTLAQAKRRRREVRVDYYPLNRIEASRWRFRPYRFVSNPLSNGFYVLGDGSRDGDAYVSLSLKFDRIQDVRLCDERFEIVDMARFQAHHGQAWGVWSSAREPVPVVLRFEPRHYDRLLESIWHPSQSIRADASGYVIFRVAVSEPDEMVPWIRSWGSGVVVEEPEELRRRVIRTVLRQARHYGLALGSGDGQPSTIHLLWAKYDRKTGDYHLLVYHLLDVAAVAEGLWELALSQPQKAWIQDALRMDAEGARQLLALLAGLHDIGKATPDFQKQAKPLFTALREAGFSKSRENTPHGTLSAVILKRWLQDKGIAARSASQLAAVIGGHHGDWITTREMQDARTGQGKWRGAQDELLAALEEQLPLASFAPPTDTGAFNAFAAFLAGFVSVCDWIGSSERHFPFEERILDHREYIERSRERARDALRELGWARWTPDKRQPAFESVFEFSPNPMQRAGLDALRHGQDAPRLILVEYLTGGGKTELALHIADALINRHDLGGCYIAMPTQATSNQMYERVGQYLERRYPQDGIRLRLIHGGAQQIADQRMQARPQREGDESAGAFADWFQNRKRALLAPFGVGAIDQAMLSVLQARHHFVRQFALSKRVVVFDEIHSYDTYMNVIIERLFNWLGALGTPMILLSATLSRQNRRELLLAAGAKDFEGALEQPYPRLTVVEQDGSVSARCLPPPPSRTVRIEAISSDHDRLLREVKSRSAEGGCIAIVCNTVDESIEVARHLRGDDDLANIVWLFHARYPPARRAEIEADVLKAFGKDSQRRPQRAILVATQIIEQSLDLDFDLMVSRTAPIDLLIQRVGTRASARSR